MEKHYAASAYIIDPITKKILLVKHKDMNKWVQPGGHIEDNETPEEAALREAYEETGIKAKLIGERFPREDDFIRPLGIQCNRKEDCMMIDIIYAAVPVTEDQEMKKNNESIDVGWFSRNELENLSVFPDIKITMDYILNNYIK